MKLKPLIILSFIINTFTIYSQKDVIKKENILIIADLTNDYITDIKEVFPTYFHNFNLNQIGSEIILAPSKNISCIIETSYINEIKFGNTEQRKLSEMKYFYDENGFLNKIGNDEFKIGKFGEEIKRGKSYETDLNGVSKYYAYNQDGALLKRYEIFYNNSGQIIKYDSYDGNDKSKELTKTFEYDNNYKLVKSSLVQNYENDVKIIPRRNITYSYTNNKMISKSISNDFAEGINSISDFSKIGGITLNDFINKKKLKITISDKSIQEIKKGILSRWENSVIYYEYLFAQDVSLNNWHEKYIYNKLYNQTTENELKYLIKREYITSEKLKKENNLTEARNKLNTFIEDIKSDEALKTKENSERFTSLNINIQQFCRWVSYDYQYSLTEDNNCSKEIVDFYKNNSNNLVKNYKEKIDNKILNNEELNLEFNKISTEYQKIIDQTIQKIKERKIIVDSLLKDRLIDQKYKNPKIAGSPTFAPNSRDPYEGFKKEKLYYAYKKLYKSTTSEIDINKHLELHKIQDKLLYLETLDTKKLEKTLRNTKNETEIVTAILNFQIE